MSDFARINAPRVEKIIEALDLIAKSARSQRVEGAFEHASLLKPVLDRLLAIGCELIDSPAPATQLGGDDRPNALLRYGEASPVQPRSQPQRSDMALRAILEEAPLRDLPMAMAVIMNRVDEVLAIEK